MKPFLLAFQHLGFPKRILVLCDLPLDPTHHHTVAHYLRTFLGPSARSLHPHHHHNPLSRSSPESSSSSTRRLNEVSEGHRVLSSSSSSRYNEDHASNALHSNYSYSHLHNGEDAGDEAGLVTIISEEYCGGRVDTKAAQEDEGVVAADNSKRLPWPQDSFDLILGRGVICVCGTTAGGGPCGLGEEVVTCKTNFVVSTSPSPSPSTSTSVSSVGSFVPVHHVEACSTTFPMNIEEDEEEQPVVFSMARFLVEVGRVLAPSSSSSSASSMSSSSPSLSQLHHHHHHQLYHQALLHGDKAGCGPYCLHLWQAAVKVLKSAKYPVSTPLEEDIRQRLHVRPLFYEQRMRGLQIWKT